MPRPFDVPLPGTPRRCCKRAPRGVTLLELLLSLGLLGSLMVPLVFFVREVTRRLPELEAEVSWEIAARRILQTIHDDFSQRRQAKVQVEEGVLVIQTRERGRSLVRRFRHDPGSGALLLDRAPIDGRRPGSGAAEVILGEVERWSCVLDPDQGRLEVALHSTRGFRCRRTFLLSP